MSKINKMLIDASHPEETRVVVVRNGRVEEFDFESASRKPLRGNIYLAKITRVEPSLQAAFVEYGGNRHGFLAFNEIHPDYYQIPMADRMALLEEEAAQEAAEEAEADAHAERLARRRNGRSGARDGDREEAEPREAREGNGGRDGGGRQNRDRDRRRRGRGRGRRPEPASGSAHADDAADSSIIEVPVGDDYEPETIGGEGAGDDDVTPRAAARDETEHGADVAPRSASSANAGDQSTETGSDARTHHATDAQVEPGETRRIDAPADADLDGDGDRVARHETRSVSFDDRGSTIVEAVADHDLDHHGDATRGHSDARGPVEEDGEDADEPGNGDDDGLVQVEPAAAEIDVIEPEGAEDLVEEVPQRPRRRMRSYKIQEVIKRRQVVLIQVVKEERGNKGAALTTYLSLAGRYTVLMPNTARGGGISRKITNPSDRKRLKAAAQDLDVPEGMGLIVRTAGAAREAQEIKRDFEYLLRLWESVRELTLQSTAPTLVYEEGNLIKRSIRDLYNKDIDEVVVSGEAGYREAHDFMRMLSPAQARNVVHYQGHEPLLARFRVEQQLAALFSPQVTLRSGGYIVINQTEALVAIDVNSGKSTREYSIEETALNTNLEAAEEVARQVRLRDLAGLIVIDFIDMEEKRNNRAVERRLKDSLRNDRARIQLGRISHFGLMEMSRQRLRTGVVEGSTSQCPHCQGSGIIRSIESIALAVLRGIEDALMGGTRMALVAYTTPQVALYILNAKRGYITDMEARHGLPITVQGSDKLQGANFTIEKIAATVEPVRRRPVASPVNMEWGFDESEENLDSADAAGGVEDIGDDRDDADATRADASDRQSGDGGRRRRRRRGRRGRRDERGGQDQAVLADDYGTPPSGGYDGEPAYDDADAGRPGAVFVSENAGQGPADADVPREFAGDDRGEDESGDGGGGARRGRRRGRRGGRRSQGGERGDGVERSVGPGVGASTDAARFGAEAAANGIILAYHEDGSLAATVSPLPLDAGRPNGEPAFDFATGSAGTVAPRRPFGRLQASEGRSHDNETAQVEGSAPVDVATTGPSAIGAGSAKDGSSSVGSALAGPAHDVPASAAPSGAIAAPAELPIDAVPDNAAAAPPEPTEPPKARRSTVSSEPLVERVVVGNAPTDVEPAPVKRGWWQKKS